MPVSDFQVVLGLEVHAQLLTRTKIFCGCPTAFGGEPNTHVCPVCLGLPGVLGGTTQKLTLEDAKALEKIPGVSGEVLWNERQQRGEPAGMDAWLAATPDGAPMPGDETLPEH